MCYLLQLITTGRCYFWQVVVSVNNRGAGRRANEVKNSVVENFQHHPSNGLFDAARDLPK